MSDCYVCHQSRVYGTASGICLLCRQPVCTPPPRYQHLIPHADECRCDCPQPGFYCVRDIRKHLKTHKGEPEDCFPLVSASASGRVMAATAPALATGARGLSDEDRYDVNLFLNVITPGADALLSVFGSIPKSEAVVDRAMFADHDRPGVEFTPAFFEGGAIERAFVLAAHSFGRAAPHADFAAFDFQETVVTESRFKFAHEWTLFARQRIPAPSAEAIASWLPKSLRDRTGNIERLLRYTPVPSRMDDMIDWFVFDNVAEPA